MIEVYPEPIQISKTSVNSKDIDENLFQISLSTLTATPGSDEYTTPVPNIFKSDYSFDFKQVKSNNKTNFGDRLYKEALNSREKIMNLRQKVFESREKELKSILFKPLQKYKKIRKENLPVKQIKKKKQ